MQIKRLLRLFYRGVILLFSFFLLACTTGNDDDDDMTETLSTETTIEDSIDSEEETSSGNDSNACLTSAEGECITVTIGESDQALERSYFLRMPQGSVEASPPLLVAPHGQGGTVDFQMALTYAKEIADQNGYILAVPIGIALQGPFFTGATSWVATSACCFFDSIVLPSAIVPDDVAFMTQIIEDQIGQNNIDPNRVFFMGHSNGAFLSHRMACEVSEKVTAIVTIGGVQRRDLDQCQPENNVSALHVHGTSDQTISYLGNTINQTDLPDFYNPLTYPSARATVNRWAGLNDCDSSTVSESFVFTTHDRQDGQYDELLMDRMGTLETYSGCENGTSVQFVSVEGGTHTPLFEQEKFIQVVGNFLENFGTRTTSAVPDEQDAPHTFITDPSFAIVGLSGNNEVPAVETDSFGDAILTQISDTEIRFEINLFNQSPAEVTGIHIHEAAAGNNGDVIVTLYDPAAESPSFEGDSLYGTVTVAAGTLAVDGDYYVNLHTNENPAGEIRGTVQFGNAPIKLETTLSGANETEVIDASASGTASVTLRSTQVLAYSLTTSPTLAEEILAIHIHRAATGVDGGVVLTLFPIPSGLPDPNDFDGEGSGGTIVSSGGLKFETSEDGSTATVSGDVENRTGMRGLYEEMISNPDNFYINAHSAAAPAGIIRGQLQFTE